MATQLLIRTSEEHLTEVILYLQGREGFSDAYPTTRQGGYTNLEARYNHFIGYREKRDLRNSIKNRGGELIEASPLGKKSIINVSSKTKKTLRDSSIISTLAFLGAIGGSKAFTSLDIETIIGTAIIPALTAFFTKIALDLGVSDILKNKESASE